MNFNEAGKVEKNPLDTPERRMEDANEKLAALLGSLKTQEEDGISSKGTVEEINGLLQSAIYNFPQIAEAVKISLRPGAIRETKQTIKEMIKGKIPPEVLHNLPSSDILFYFHLGKIPSLDTDTPILILPLPYSFKSKTHGGGMREAMTKGEETVLFEIVIMNDTLQKRVFLGVRLEPVVFLPKFIFFPLESIEKVQFTKGEGYSPLLSCKYSYNPDVGDYPFSLIKRESPVLQYLYFRQFLPSTGDRSASFIIPQQTGNLWKYGKGGLLAHGFFSDVGGSALYEVTDLKLQYGFEEKEEKLEKILKEAVEKRQCKIYHGNEIIERLAQIPVEERGY